MSENTNEVVEKQKKVENEPWGSYLYDMATGVGMDPPPYLGSGESNNFALDALGTGQGISFGQDVFSKVKSLSQYAVSNTVGAPQYDLRDETATTAQDNISGNFANSGPAVMSQSGVPMQNPNFDTAHMKKDLLDLEIHGAGSDLLEEAMVALYSDPKGVELDEALEKVKKARGLNMSIDELRDQYTRAMEIKKKGEEYAAANGSTDEVSPSFDPADLQAGGQHEGFSGSQTQLAFGARLGQLTDLDPVFGSLISPTGGAVGPGSDSITNAEYENPAVLHGIMHDLAGYLYNAHGIGPGYNYTNAPYELPTHMPISGQVSGMGYMTDRNPLLNTMAIGGTFIKNIPWHGLSSDNFVQSGVEVGSGNGFSDAADATGDFFSGVWDGAKGLASNAYGAAQYAGGKVKDGAQFVGNKVMEGAQFVGDKASSIFEGAKGLAGSAISGAQNLGSQALSGAQNLGNQAISGGKSLLEGVSGLASSAAGSLKSIGSNAISGAKGLANDAFSGVQNMGSSGMDLLKSAGTNVTDAIQGIGTHVNLTKTHLGEEIHSKWEDTQEFFSNGFSSLGW